MHDYQIEKTQHITLDPVSMFYKRASTLLSHYLCVLRRLSENVV